MGRTGVAPATGGLLGVQTFAPALFGIIVLGDEVRDGFGWLVVVGLGVTLLGALSLSSRATPVADARVDTAQPSSSSPTRPEVGWLRWEERRVGKEGVRTCRFR